MCRETYAAGEPSPRIWAWTYGASQKVRNLERDPRATLQVEAAEEYHELRGVMLECETVVHRELELVAELGAEILLRNSVPRGVPPPVELPSEVRDVVTAQAVKRVGLEFVERRRATGIIASWAGSTDSAPQVGSSGNAATQGIDPLRG